MEEIVQTLQYFINAWTSRLVLSQWFSEQSINTMGSEQEAADIYLLGASSIYLRVRSRKWERKRARARSAACFLASVPNTVSLAADRESFARRWSTRLLSLLLLCAPEKTHVTDSIILDELIRVQKYWHYTGCTAGRVPINDLSL